ncbi:HNH endonuclease [Mycolicibacterium fortuitum]|nr:HNH endonuclease [Mycolicibacterium fortuitum]
MEDLSVDHLLPVSDYPELEYAEENCRILCKPCNGKRGNKFTTADAHTVLTRLQHSYQRRPTKNCRQRVDIAQKAVLTRGEGPSGPLPSPVGKAHSALHTPGGMREGGSEGCG